MRELEANCMQMAPVLESEGDNNRLQEVGGLIKDVAAEELNLKARIEEAEKLLAKIRQDKLELAEDIAQRVCDRRCTLLPRLDCLISYGRGLKYCLTLEREKMNILQLFLLRFTDKASQRKPIQPCLPGEEISKPFLSLLEMWTWVQKLNFRMGHGTKSLAKEKQLLKQINRNIVQYRLRQIQQLKSQRESLAVLLQGQWDEAIANASGNANANANSAANAAANAIAKGKIWDSLGSKKSLLEQIKVTCKAIDGLTKLLLAVRPKINQVENELKVAEKDIETLQKKLPWIDQKKDEAHQCIHKLKKQQSEEI
ncbi:uncharacterized protein Pyn_02556 [Prunus yedoensis var. nudiflora]|uniref:Uncharacterized protein n=1 Tax=Prunus yedoensis var. nudiflora TaxID=2094558 RepID=A0A314UJT7_PRUYE|nr:uncharacterized protein Pyn_02556 [Prunus yedoensis var. nudiflora]